MGQPNLQYLALQRYFGSKDGRSEKEVIRQLALQDAMYELDSVDPEAIEGYAKQRAQEYQEKFSKISNVTVLDPDPKLRHKFESSCYQEMVQEKINKYRYS